METAKTSMNLSKCLPTSPTAVGVWAGRPDSPFPPALVCVLPARRTEEPHVLSGQYLAQLQVRQGAGINESLGYHRETGIDVVCLVNVEDELGVLQDVDPKPQR